MKVLVAEDDASSRLLLRRILKKAGHEPVLANDGEEALNVLNDQKFDAILTDWMMPNIDGLELIKKVRKKIVPSPIIFMITALDSFEAKEKAMDAGADDYIAKPINNADLLHRLENWHSLHQSEFTGKIDVDKEIEVKKPPFVGVAVAASTGGPKTLVEIFGALKPTKDASIFIVLHAPNWMLQSFEHRLQQQIDMPVYLADDEMPVKPGEVYLAPGDYHMVINKEKFCLELSDAPPVNYVKPAADPLFKDVAHNFGKKSIGVVLTGMGHDGSVGAGYIKAAGGIVIAQDPNTAILGSMPKTAIKLGLADLIVPTENIPQLMNHTINKVK